MGVLCSRGLCTGLISELGKSKCPEIDGLSSPHNRANLLSTLTLQPRGLFLLFLFVFSSSFPHVFCCETHERSLLIPAAGEETRAITADEFTPLSFPAGVKVTLTEPFCAQIRKDFYFIAFGSTLALSHRQDDGVRYD